MQGALLNVSSSLIHCVPSDSAGSILEDTDFFVGLARCFPRGRRFMRATCVCLRYLPPRKGHFRLFFFPSFPKTDVEDAERFVSADLLLHFFSEMPSMPFISIFVEIAGLEPLFFLDWPFQHSITDRNLECKVQMRPSVCTNRSIRLGVMLVPS